MSTLAHARDAALADRLHKLYHDASKHSVYQSVPAFVARALGYQEEIHSLWRSDAPRYDYLAARLGLPTGATIADIGANTGFFSLNLAHTRPDLRIAAYELNPRHAEFIRLAAGAFGLEGVQVRAQSCDLAGLDRLPVFDAVLLLNVVHHAGFDFDGALPDSNEAFTTYARDYLARLRAHSRRLVFQIGSNRGGDKGRPLFERDNDVARLHWIADVLKAAGWEIDMLGYAQLDEASAVVFRDAPEVIRQAANAGMLTADVAEGFFTSARLGRFPGEFHRRPLIIAQRREGTT
jgi:hypothetical protein